MIAQERAPVEGKQKRAQQRIDDFRDLQAPVVEYLAPRKSSVHRHRLLPGVCRQAVFG